MHLAGGTASGLSCWSHYRVLKEVHPDVGISKQGMQVMQTFAVDMFDRIMVEASRLCRISNKATLSSREIQTAGECNGFTLLFTVLLGVSSWSLLSA